MSTGHTPERNTRSPADRLSPLATAETTAAVEQLGIPDYGSDVVEVYPGAAERTETPNTYSVGCSTLTTGPDGAPTAPPAAVFSEVTMIIQGPWWVVAGAVGAASSSRNPAPTTQRSPPVDSVARPQGQRKQE